MNGVIVASLTVLMGCSAALAAAQEPTTSGAPASAAATTAPVTAAAGSAPADATPPAEARIPFANHRGIYSWHVVDDKTVLIQAQNRQWYKATLMTPCFDLPFANTIGFATNADGSFDRFSAIKLRRQKCQLISLVKSDPPPKKAKKSSAPTPPPAPASAATP